MATRTRLGGENLELSTMIFKTRSAFMKGCITASLVAASSAQASAATAADVTSSIAALCDRPVFADAGTIANTISASPPLSRSAGFDAGSDTSTFDLTTTGANTDGYAISYSLTPFSAGNALTSGPLSNTASISLSYNLGPTFVPFMTASEYRKASNTSRTVNEDPVVLFGLTVPEPVTGILLVTALPLLLHRRRPRAGYASSR